MIVHVVPERDLIEHETNLGPLCVCVPRRVEAHPGVVYVHTSLDGRELSAPPIPDKPTDRSGVT